MTPVIVCARPANRPTYKQRLLDDLLSGAHEFAGDLPSILRRLASAANAAAEAIESSHSERTADPPLNVEPPAFDAIIQEVAQFYNVSRHNILGPGRIAHNVVVRHVAMYLVRHIMHQSTPVIGRLFGNRDHTTVIYALKKVEREIKTNAVLAAQIQQLRAKLDGRV